MIKIKPNPVMGTQFTFVKGSKTLKRQVLDLIAQHGTIERIVPVDNELLVQWNRVKRSMSLDRLLEQCE